MIENIFSSLKRIWANKGNRISFFATIFLWTAFCVFFSIFPLYKKTETYKTIKITLNADPVKPVSKPVEKIEKIEPVEQIKPIKPIEKEIVKKTDVIKKENLKAPKKNDSKPTQSTSEEVYRPRLKKSVDDLMNETAVSETSTWSEDVFNSSSKANIVSSKKDGEDISSIKKDIRSISDSDAVKGSAGKIASSDTSVSSKENEAQNNSKGNSESLTPDARTTEALLSFRSSSYSTSSENGVQSEVTANVESSSDSNSYVKINTDSGKGRMLLNPMRPVILISKENALLVDSSRTVTIFFTIMSSGKVPLSEITISPQSLLPLEIQNEIKAQISSWIFSNSENQDKAEFVYKIIKK